jgi:hypothetical protein
LVSGESQISRNAWVFGYSRIFGKTNVSGDAQVSGKCWVSGMSKVYGTAKLSGDDCLTDCEIFE